MRILSLAAATLLLIGSAACGGSEPTPSPEEQVHPLTIGLLLDRLEHERWQRDRDLFVKRVEERGGRALVRSGDGDAAHQLEEARALLDEGAKVLVVVPTDLEKAAEIVQAASEKNVPVISYDRLIANADIALYVSFDNVKVGRMQAEHLLHSAPKGNYVLLGGAPTDNNAKLVREGQMAVLEPAIESGAINIVADPWVPGWGEETAKEEMEAALKKTRRIAAVVASNDAMAGGAIEALAAAKMAGKVPVSGQDADLAACQRIIEGTQAMTVYKPLEPLARMAADAAIRFARGEAESSLVKVDNGMKEVPARLLDPISVDKANIDVTVISDGYHQRSEVYGGGE
jgi:D-xylose transport system substrate-binding protein